MSVAARFGALAGGPEAAFALDEACLLIAARAGGADDAGADAVVASGRAELDALASGVGDATVEGLRAFLFDTVGFTGNRDHYDDPRNSYLDHVLARRTGIPITLSIVVIEVGRRIGIPLAGVGMPGHFVVAAGPGRYLDAFEGGRLLDAEGCRRRFVEIAGPDAPWSPELLAPVGPRAIVARVLANLRARFTEARDLRGLDWVLELRAGIPGVPARERAERAAILSALGRFDAAASELEQLSTAAGWHPSEGVTGADLRARAARLRARLN